MGDLTIATLVLRIQRRRGRLALPAEAPVRRQDQISGILDKTLTWRTPGDTMEKSSRGGAVAARRAHNPKVGGSNPLPATRNKDR